jgi:DNA polymerase V
MYSNDSSTAPVPLNAGARVLVGLLDQTVQAGFPSPAEDHACKRIDLNEILVRHPQASFVLRVRGSSMRDAGIDDGDVVLVDKAIKPAHGQVVVAVVDGEFTVKRLYAKDGQIKLQASNKSFRDICPGDGQTVEVWGVVTHAIKSMPT